LLGKRPTSVRRTTARLAPILTGRVLLRSSATAARDDESLSSAPEASVSASLVPAFFAEQQRGG